jgi:hypothetical protein
MAGGKGAVHSHGREGKTGVIEADRARAGFRKEGCHGEGWNTLAYHVGLRSLPAHHGRIVRHGAKL